jgi:hypothetical protein
VQGSVLGTLLISIFINDIVAQIDFCRLHVYADDVQLCLSDDPCSLDEYLFLNPEKSQAIVFPDFVQRLFCAVRGVQQYLSVRE